MTLNKPASIESDVFKSKKWDEITAGRSFRESDAPTIELLCQWHLIVKQCIDDLDDFGTLIHVDGQDKPHAWPQIEVMKKASAEIRQLNKQLGINDEVKSEQPSKGVTVIHAFRENRQSKSQAAARAATG